MKNPFSFGIRFVIVLFLLLFPLFFLPTTQEFYVTNKLYLLGASVLIMGTLATLRFLTDKKLSWKKTMFDGSLILLLLSYGISIVLASPNKYQALLNPTNGFAIFFFLVILYFFMTQENHEIRFETLIRILSIPASLLAILALVFFFNPLANVNFPPLFQFLRLPSFTPMGTQLDLAVFLGFFVVYGLTKLFRQEKEKTSPFTFDFAIFMVIFVAFLLVIYNLVKNLPQLPPLSISWYAAVETLKQPISAFFGVGIDNFASMFTRVKPAQYNMSSTWNLNFNIGASFLLQLWVEAGLLGIVSFGFIVLTLIREWGRIKLHEQMGFLYLLAIFLFLPFSFPALVLFVLLLAALNNGLFSQEKREISLVHIIPLYMGIGAIAFVAIAGASYVLGRAYSAEYYYRQSLNALTTNDAQKVYKSQRSAIVLNPYIERYRASFAQLNLFIANNISSKKPEELTEEDKQNITQAIQAAIAEAKAAVALNPQKAANWENLAIIYRNIINIAQGADVWTIASYQRAIVADPQNPLYRVNLGGVYYTLANYDEAIKFFEQAASMKSNWPNAQYNLAWALFQKKNYAQAAATMQNVLTLLDPQSDDYKKASQDLEEFKKNLPSSKEEEKKELQPEQLTLPTPQPTLSPKIQLPEEASPEGSQ